MDFDECMTKFKCTEEYMPKCFATKIINENFHGLTFQEAENIISEMSDILSNMSHEQKVIIKE